MEREHKPPEKETKKTTNLIQHVSPATENKKNVQPESEITELKQLVQDMSIYKWKSCYDSNKREL